MPQHWMRFKRQARKRYINTELRLTEIQYNFLLAGERRLYLIWSLCGALHL